MGRPNWGRVGRETSSSTPVAAAIGHNLAGQVIEIRLLAHLARLRWAKSLISALIATAWALVANN